MERTEKCVCCLDKPAEFWEGYVLKGSGRGPDADEKVIAGWCAECREDHCVVGQAFSGRYVTAMGRKPVA